MGQTGKVKVNLHKTVTFKGENYDVGIQEFDEKAAANIVRKKLGEYVEINETVLEIEDDFTPLSLEETMERFTSGDSSEMVFKSLKFHQPAIAEKKIAESRASGENRQPDDINSESSGEKTEDKENFKEPENNSPITSEGIPADFPQRHIFVKLGFKSVAEIQAKTREELIALNGVAETTADKALAFGKN